MHRILALVILTAACSSAASKPAVPVTSTEPSEAAETPAPAEIDSGAAAPSAARKPAAPIAVDRIVACADLIDVATFGSAFGSEVEVKDLEKFAQRRQASAVCRVIRSGERPDRDAQAKLLADNGKLGVLPGDHYCEIVYYCALPAQDDSIDRCKAQPNASASDVDGAHMCVTVSQRGADDAYRYKLVEPDTGCLLDVQGGFAVVGQEIPLICVKAALESVTATSLDSYR